MDNCNIEYRMDDVNYRKIDFVLDNINYGKIKDIVDGRLYNEYYFDMKGIDSIEEVVYMIERWSNRLRLIGVPDRYIESYGIVIDENVYKEKIDGMLLKSGVVLNEGNGVVIEGHRISCSSNGEFFMVVRGMLKRMYDEQVSMLERYCTVKDFVGLVNDKVVVSEKIVCSQVRVPMRMKMTVEYVMDVRYNEPESIERQIFRDIPEARFKDIENVRNRIDMN